MQEILQNLRKNWVEIFMVINFWQNIVSIHQLPFIEELSRIPNIKVNLIVSNSSNQERKNMGWDIKINKSVNLCYIHDINILSHIQSSQVNVFSGFFVYKDLNHALSICLRENKKIFIYSEGKDDIGFKGFLRLIKDSVIIKYKLNTNVKFLAIGDKGVRWFSKIGVPNNQIIKFGYFTKEQKIDNYFEKIYEKRIVFVGRLLNSKGILELIKSFNDERLINFSLDIYGNGILENEVDFLIKNYNLENRVRRFDFIKNDVMREKLKDYDILALPNIGDEGWGAVINEGLQSGLKIICSKKTGAACLVKASGAGIVLDKVNDESLVDAILTVDNLNISRKYIFNWSKNNISPSIAATKFNSILMDVEDRFDW